MKSFAMPAVFPLMRQSLDGTTASGLYEARLGKEEFGKEVHVYAPAYTENTLQRTVTYQPIISISIPLHRSGAFCPAVRAAGIDKKVGIRINPGYSKATLGGHLYDPCSPGCRFGVVRAELDKLDWDEIDILHVHALCESLHDGSAGLINHIAGEFATYIKRVEAVNFGGGHFINKQGYDIETLINAIRDFRTAFAVEVILEPGSGLVVDAGYLVATVLDIVHNEKAIAILDASASCHMPDVLEVPYTPPLFGAASPGCIPIPASLAATPAWRAMLSANILLKSP